MQTVFVILFVLSLSFVRHCYKQIHYDKTSLPLSVVISLVLLIIAISVG